MRKLNEDGKFLDRLIPALIAATMGCATTAVVFWSDSRANDREAALAISRFDREIAEIKREVRVDRDRTTDLAADVKVLLAITQRIEQSIARNGAPFIPITPGGR